MFSKFSTCGKLLVCEPNVCLVFRLIFIRFIDIKTPLPNKGCAASSLCNRQINTQMGFRAIDIRKMPSVLARMNSQNRKSSPPPRTPCASQA